MGGIGSGRRWRTDADETTDDYRKLDVRSLQREGLLAPNQAYRWAWKVDGETRAYINIHSEAEGVFLSYRHRSRGSEWIDKDYSVRVVWTPCNYGGRRAWFLCPARGCERRVGILFGGGLFACRRCYRLSYQSQRETYGDRASRRADRIRERLGWEPGILNGAGIKPKGMHWRTYWKLRNAHHACAVASFAEAAQRFGIEFAKDYGFADG